MSFWSWIGLVDKKQLAQIQDDVQSLREDNRSLLKQNEELMDRLSSNLAHEREAVVHNLNDCKNYISENMELFKQSIELLSLQIKEVQQVQQNENNIVSTSYKALIDEIQRLSTNEKKNQSEILRKSEEIKVNVQDSCKVIVEQIVDCLKGYSLNLSRLLDDLQEHIRHISEDTAHNGQEILQKCAEHQESISRCSDNLKRIGIEVSEVKENTSVLNEATDKLTVLSESLNNLWTIEKAIWIDSVLDDIDSVL